MAKTHTLILACFALTLILIGCGGMPDVQAPTASPTPQVQQIPAPTSYAFFGDSVTVAAQEPDPYKWFDQICIKTGLPGSLYAAGSDQVYDTVPRIFAVPTEDNAVSTWLTGENEVHFYPDKGDLWVPFLMAGYAHRLIPDSVKVKASSASVDGSVVYVAVKADYGSTLEATVTIDGTNHGPYLAATDHITYWGSTSSPMLIRVPVPSGRHAVTVSSGTTVYWIAGNGWIPNRSRLPIVYAANMYLAEKDPAFYPFINSLNKQTVDTLRADGLDIRFVDVFTPCGTTCNDADGVHPGAVGNGTIATTFLSAIH